MKKLKRFQEQIESYRKLLIIYSKTKDIEIIAQMINNKQNEIYNLKNKHEKRKLLHSHLY